MVSVEESPELHPDRTRATEALSKPILISFIFNDLVSFDGREYTYGIAKNSER
ncbi:hypothetical protein VIOR3934_20325 [Vibrio orientalis CIP 102891 = ATCC 33934]|uniref:Uncharacterized protein n=1 Tax=Vibrio orientalis CIP 102891 = ATCC 33934 TaxID=675816 RepID=F9SM39_VIBOR|nr:hypothetical protein VIOR3934_20325 [Vibrio orientalis CIP 102891 = ATCC 33934]